MKGDIGVRSFAVLALFCLGFSEFKILKLGFVVSPFCRRFMVCRCCSRFFGSFITHTLDAALLRYTDIAVSVFNDFGQGFAVFGTFCCGFAVFATPQCPPPCAETI